MASINVEQLTEAMSLFGEFIDEAEDVLVKRKKATSERDKDCLKLEKEIQSCKRHKEKFTTRMRSLLMQLENEKNLSLREQKRKQMQGHQLQPAVVRDESERHGSNTPSSTCPSSKTRIRIMKEVSPNGRSTESRSVSKRKLATEAHPRYGSGRKSANLSNNPVSRARKEFCCVFCKTWLPTSPLLRNHVVKVHDGRRYYSCQTCGKGFAKKKNLTSHATIHREKTFSCVFCNSRFYSKQHLETHIRSHTLEKPYWCNICDHESSRQGDLFTHMRIHTGEKPFQCEICPKSFRRMSHLNRHLRSHTGEKPYVCNFCDRGFAQSADLKLHMRTHTGEKPYKCEICNHGFAVHADLVRHMRIHTGEKPYKCEICNHGFSVHTDLVRHMRIHTGEKPYQCEICNYGFALQSTLLSHMRIHTGEKPYSCQVCRKTFSTSSHCKQHQKTHEKKNFC